MNTSDVSGTEWYWEIGTAVPIKADKAANKHLLWFQSGIFRAGLPRCNYKWMRNH